MTEFPFQFPILVLTCDRGRASTDGKEYVETWLNERDFVTDDIQWTLKHYPRETKLAVDLAGQCWQVVRIGELAPREAGWRGWSRALLGPRRHARFEVEALAPIPFETIRERVCTAFNTDLPMWCEIAEKTWTRLGSDEAVLKELTARAVRTSNIGELIDVLENWVED